MEHVAALAAQPFLEHDVGHGMIDSFTALAGVEDLLGLMGARVAGAAIGDGLEVLHDFMLDDQVALRAFDFVLRDMHRVNKARVVIFFQAVRFEVTLIAVLPGHDPVADDNLAVAFVARESFVEDGRMIVANLVLNEVVLFVAVGAGADLGKIFSFFEMAEEAAALRHRDMLALDDLRMAARAAELFAAPKIGEMGLMVEGDGLELHLAFEEPLVVATLLETALVLDLSPGLGFEIELGPVTADHDQTFHLGFNSVPNPRRIVTDLALDLAV